MKKYEKRSVRAVGYELKTKISMKFISIYFSILEKTIDQNKIDFVVFFLSNVLIRFNKKEINLLLFNCILIKAVH